MPSSRVLLIGGWHLLSGLNHRVRHMAAYFEERFASLDIVGYKKMYGGIPASPMTKLHTGLNNLLHDRISIASRNGTRNITIRDIYAPPFVEMGIKDLWRYWNLCQCITTPYDVAVYGYPGNTWTAFLLKRSGRVKKLVYDDWDYHPGLETNPLLANKVERLERLSARTADVVITVNGLLAELRTQQGAQRAEVIPNGINLSLFSQARHKTQHPPTLLYMGSLSSLWNVELAIHAMPALARQIPNVRLLIAGYGPAEASLRKLSQQLGVEAQVQFLGVFAYDALPSLLAQADIGITTAHPQSSFRRYASPLKIIEYMAAGLPVIANRLGQTEIIINESGAGLLVENSPEEFAQAAASLLLDPARYAAFSRAALNYASAFDWNLLLEKAYRVVLDLLNSDGTP
jgi:glycosyltransferase involved in cell wall biosynthesis